MDVRTTPRVWTAQQAFESVLGFAIVGVIYIFA